MVATSVFVSSTYAHAVAVGLCHMRRTGAATNTFSPIQAGGFCQGPRRECTGMVRVSLRFGAIRSRARIRQRHSRGLDRGENNGAIVKAMH